METLFLDFVKQVNPVQTVTLGLIVFYFYNRLDNKIEKLEEKTEKRFEKLEAKTDENFKILLARIDAVNARLDSLYRELFKKDVA